MNVGIVAVTYKDNFGSALQTYATQYTLEKLGHHAEIFDITSIHRKIKLKKILYYLSRVKEKEELIYMIENFKSRSRKEVSVSGDIYARNMAIRHEMYRSFNKQWFKMMPSQGTWKKLTSQAKTKDAIVVGSDQLWRPSNIAGCYYTLEFVPNEINKIAFSTSFGVSELPKSLYKHSRKFLSRMNYISVREDSGAKLVKELINKDIPVICDPTMTLDAQEWMQIQDEKPFADGKYILCYFMGDNPKHREFAKKLRDKTGYRIIGLLHGATYIPEDENFADEAPYNVGPSEFINLIRNAQFICTDSFHGTVFCILNQRPFFSFRRYEDSSEFSTNDRLHTLLRWTGLSQRMLYGNEDVDTCMQDQIDFIDVLQRVADKRNFAINYLKEALEKNA